MLKNINRSAELEHLPELNQSFPVWGKAGLWVQGAPRGSRSIPGPAE